MGVYVYSLQQSKPLRTPDGPVHRCTYLHKCYYSETEKQEAIRSRILERFKLDGSVLVFPDDSADSREGRAVYFQKKPVSLYYDTEPPPGIPVGFLRKIKGRWHISTVGEEVQRSLGVLRGYADQHGLQIESMSEREWAVVRRLAGDAPTVSGELQALYDACHPHFRNAHMDERGWVVVGPTDAQASRAIEHAGNLLRGAP
jgi:hypothetical protein